MKAKIIDIYFFSGTGNTLILVKELKNFFSKHGYETNLFRIEKCDPNSINLDHTLGFAFPIAAFSTYKFIWDFLDKLPETDRETEVFMLTSMAFFSGGMTGALKKIMKKKKYKPIGANEIKMPSNFRKKEISAEKKQKSINNGINKAKKFAHDLIFGISNWRHLPVPKPFTKFGKSEKPWRFMREKNQLEIDFVKCVKCGNCYHLCPVENIEMTPYPEFADKCQLCLRCFAFCPSNAISFKDKKIESYKACDSDDILQY